MTSKFLIPLKLLNITATPANPTAGFVSLYMKNNYLTSLSSSGVVLDVVLDRPLTGFVAIAPAPIVAADTVLIAFEKLQSQINTISSGGSGQPDEYYQDLIFNAITAGTGISINYNDAGGTFAISSSITQGPTGSGTNNYLAKWTPNGTTLGTSLIQDDGTTVGIGTNDSAYLFTVSASTLNQAFRASASKTSGSGTTAGTFQSIGDGTGPNRGIHVMVSNNSNYNVGGHFVASTTSPFALWLQDGTEGTGKFLKSITGDGKANWATLTTADISGYTAYTLPTATASDLGGVKIGSGLTITAGVVSVTPTTSYAEVITFDKPTPTTAGVVFSPNTPATTGLLYVSGIDSTTWIWNGTAYITQNVTPTIGTAWFLASAPTVDAGASKTADILRSGSVNIQGTYAGNPGVTSIRPGNIYVSGDGSNTGRLHIRRKMDDATQNGAPTLYFERMRGTGGSTIYPLAGDSYGLIGFSSAGCIEVVGIENYGASTRGSDMIFRVGVIGAGSEVERLRILQNGKIRVNNKYNLPNVDGTSTQVLSTDGAGNLAWTTIAGGTTLAGAGLNNYVARWTPNGTTLGTGIIQDDGSTVSIGTAPLPGYKLYVQNTTENVGVYASNTKATTGGLSTYGLYAAATGTGTTLVNYGVGGVSFGNTNQNVGVYAQASGSSLENIGMRSWATGGTANYALQLEDGSQGIGKFLKNVSGGGRANWANITAADISGGVVGGSGTTNYLAKWTPNGSTLGNSMLQDNGTSMSVNATLTNTYGFYFSYSSGQSSIFGENSYAGAGDSIGVVGTASGIVNGTNYGGLFNAGNNVALNIGVKGKATVVTAGANIGGLFHAANGASNYAIQLLDSTSTVANRFLKNMTTDGKANWETSFTIDTNKVAKFEGQVVSLLSTNNAPTGTTQTINWNSGNSQTMALGSATGNVALTFTNPVAGATYFLRIVQGTTPRQISFSTIVKFPGGTAPTLTATANAVDTIVIFYDGVSYFGNYSLNYI